MGLLDDIRALDAQPERNCVFGDFIATLPPADQADVTTALADMTITTKAIFVACRNRGYVGGDTVVRRHRRGECLCH